MKTNRTQEEFMNFMALLIHVTEIYINETKAADENKPLPEYLNAVLNEYDDEGARYIICTEIALEFEYRYKNNDAAALDKYDEIINTFSSEFFKSGHVSNKDSLNYLQNIELLPYPMYLSIKEEDKTEFLKLVNELDWYYNEEANFLHPFRPSNYEQ